MVSQLMFVVDYWSLFVVVAITVVESNIESIFWIFSWVRRSTLQLGGQGGKRKREREKYMQLSV
jgi:hypothetical protein